MLGLQIHEHAMLLCLFSLFNSHISLIPLDANVNGIVFIANTHYFLYIDIVICEPELD